MWSGQMRLCAPGAPYACGYPCVPPAYPSRGAVHFMLEPGSLSSAQHMKLTSLPQGGTSRQAYGFASKGLDGCGYCSTTCPVAPYRTIITVAITMTKTLMMPTVAQKTVLSGTSFCSSCAILRMTTNQHHEYLNVSLGAQGILDKALKMAAGYPDE